MKPRGTDDDMWLTLREASQAFDVSLSTLHRRRRSGELEDVGAFKDGDTWKVPRQGLARLGFKELIPPVIPGQVSIDEALSDISSETSSMTPPDTANDTGDSAELKRLREQLYEAQRNEAEYRHRAEVAEARADERDRTIKAQEMALRMLEAAPADRRAPEPTPEREPQQPQEKKRPWWRLGL